MILSHILLFSVLRSKNKTEFQKNYNEYKDSVHREVGIKLSFRKITINIKINLCRKKKKTYNL